MSRGRRVLAWLPPFFVGASAAIAAEVALGILLYAGEGLMRSLSTTLVVEVVAFSAGLAMAPQVAPDLIDRLRRRWLLCLLVFLAAAFFGTSWSVLREMGGSALTQGLGLALLGALPLYMAGSVLAGLSVVARSDGSQDAVQPGVPAALGAALGFAITGYALARAPMPSSLLIGCLILLSLGGMLYGVVLGGRLEVEKKASRPWASGGVRVEDRRLSAEKKASRILFEGPFERRRSTLAGAEVSPWEVMVARALMPDATTPWRVLMVGGGVSDLPRTVLREHAIGTVDVLERVAAAVELGREYFETDLRVGQDLRWTLRVANLEDAIAEVDGAYDLIVIDGAALRSIGGSSGLSRRARSLLARRIRPGGVVAWGPEVDGVSEVLPGWTAHEFRRTVPGGPGEEPVEETVLLQWQAAPEQVMELPGFTRHSPAAAVP